MTYAVSAARYLLKAQKAFDNPSASTSSCGITKGLSICIVCALSVVVVVVSLCACLSRLASVYLPVF